MRDRLKSSFRTAGFATAAWGRRRPTAASDLPMIVCILVSVLLIVPATAGAVLPGPNGMIVFTSGRDDGLTALDDAHAQLWVAKKAGATPTRVTFNTAIQHRHASWSPDRTELVYSAGNSATGDFDLYILNLTQPASSTNPRDLTQSPGSARTARHGHRTVPVSRTSARSWAAQRRSRSRFRASPVARSVSSLRSAGTRASRCGRLTPRRSITAWS